MNEKTCEREGCEAEGVTYYRYGHAVSTGPFTSSSRGLQPEQPIDLCSTHALEAFGVSFT